MKSFSIGLARGKKTLINQNQQEDAMKYHNHQDGSGKYMLITMIIAILATAIFSGTVNMHSLAADAKHALGSLYHVIAGA